MVLRREGSVEPNVVSVRNSTKNLSALATQLRESIERCAELTATKNRLLQDEHDEKIKCRRLQAKLAVCAANQRKLYAQKQQLRQQIEAPRFQQAVTIAGAELAHLTKAGKEAQQRRRQRNLELERVAGEIEVERNASASLRKLVSAIKEQLQVQEKQRDRARHQVEEARKQLHHLTNQLGTRQRLNRNFAESLLTFSS